MSPEFGSECFKYILNAANFTEDDWLFFLENDSVGNPYLSRFDFGDSMVIASPTTLRYVKVLVDVLTLFDATKIRTVTEIGGGYGGQCRILMNFLPIELYNLVDLPEALALAEKFLTALDTAGDVRYLDGTHLYNDAPCDLVISDYAFSELSKSAQEVYLEKILSKARAGYVTWDGEFFADAGLYDGLTLEEFVSILPFEATILPENPVTTSETNRVVIWGANPKVRCSA
ncbi:MAG: putative sugar O-methyltransferase [Selenomonadaceae bacterium]|nr:putative sugar O-methyltransferase [Selenomonadaceae bacterium]